MRSLTQHKAEGRRAYTRPSIRLVLLDTDDELLQGVMDTSGYVGPGVNPSEPIDPDDPGLANSGSVWDH